MAMLLSRVLPYDIAEHVFNLVKRDHIANIIEGRIFLIEAMMSGMTRFWVDPVSLYNVDYNALTIIHNMIEEMAGYKRQGLCEWDYLFKVKVMLFCDDLLSNNRNERWNDFSVVVKKRIDEIFGYLQR